MKRRGKLMVFVDGECVLCRVTSSVLQTADRTGVASVTDLRTDGRYRDYGVTDDAASARLQVIDTTTGAVYEGFTAVRAIALEVPLLWPLRPILALLSFLGVGDAVYDFIAMHRPRKRRQGATRATP